MSLLVYVTAPDAGTALGLARTLVESRLAAGVNVLPGATSVYRWRGEIREEGECVLVAQVAREAFEDMRDCVLRAHPYEVPCIVALPIGDGHGPFLRWIHENSIPAAAGR